MHLQWIAIVSTLAGLGATGAIERRATCTSYTLLNTRGTSEPQGESSGFKTMNANILKQVSGGKIVGLPQSYTLVGSNTYQYNTVYPAGLDQNSSAGTQDIINHIKQTLAKNPSQCFILQGYSQGAAATVNALPSLTGASFTAVKGVFLIGDPEHRPGLSCNVDNNGGTTTRNAIGLEASYTAGIPSNWVSKSLDVCIFGDGVCDTAHGVGITPQHLQYPADAPTQNLGTSFAVGKLRSTS